MLRDLPAVRGQAPWPGHEHVKGWGVVGLPFDSGHVLALRIAAPRARPLPLALRHHRFARIAQEEPHVSAPAILVAALALSAAGDPFVYEVPAGGASLDSQRRPLFFAAAFTIREGRVVRGAWMPSDEVLGQGPTRVVVVASWCPACHRLLERLSAQRPQTAV